MPYIPGIDPADMKALMDAARAQHPKGGMQTATPCVCGSGSGGKAGSPACRALLGLVDRVRYPQHYTTETPKTDAQEQG